jgi:glutathione S-transferase
MTGTTKIPGLALYHFDGCPYCGRVRTALDRLGLEIELRDTHASPGYAQELIAATGRRTVPVLRIEEAGGALRWMPESLDIVAYLEKHFGADPEAAGSRG